MQDRVNGLLEKADGGTLLLDEVSELPLPVQGKLLRFLEDKSLQRIGGSEQLTGALQQFGDTVAAAA